MNNVSRSRETASVVYSPHHRRLAELPRGCITTTRHSWLSPSLTTVRTRPSPEVVEFSRLRLADIVGCHMGRAVVVREYNIHASEQRTVLYTRRGRRSRNRKVTSSVTMRTANGRFSLPRKSESLTNESGSHTVDSYAACGYGWSHQSTQKPRCAVEHDCATTPQMES